MANSKSSSAVNEETVKNPTADEINALRAKYPDSVQLWLVGGEYVSYGCDAQKLAISVYGIDPVLATQMGGGIKEFSFPISELKKVLHIIVNAGLRVVIKENHGR